MNDVKSIGRIPISDYYWTPNIDFLLKAMLEAQFSSDQQEIDCC